MSEDGGIFCCKEYTYFVIGCILGFSKFEVFAVSFQCISDWSYNASISLDESSVEIPES
jgi:hypothetical protein